MIAQHQERIESTPKAIVADSKYGTSANFIALAQAGLRSHMADLRRKQNNHRLEGIYPSDRFTYQSAKDTYQCPAGEKLYRHHFVESRGYSEYRTRVGPVMDVNYVRYVHVPKWAEL